MTTIEINKANWSGETAKLKVRKDGSFDMHGYRIGVEADPAKGTGKVTIDGKPTDMTLYFFEGRDGRPGTWRAESYDIARENEVVQVAVAQVLFNTL